MKKHDISMEGELAQVKPNVYMRRIIIVFKNIFYLKIYIFKKLFLKLLYQNNKKT
jgi:hypothetical protein